MQEFLSPSCPCPQDCQINFNLKVAPLLSSRSRSLSCCGDMFLKLSSCLIICMWFQSIANGSNLLTICSGCGIGLYQEKYKIIIVFSHCSFLYKNLWYFCRFYVLYLPCGILIKGKLCVKWGYISSSQSSHLPVSQRIVSKSWCCAAHTFVCMCVFVCLVCACIIVTTGVIWNYMVIIFLILELAWALCAIFSTSTCKHLIVAKISLILQKYSTQRKYLACRGETRPTVTTRCQHWTEIHGQPCSQHNELLCVCVRVLFTMPLSPTNCHLVSSSYLKIWFPYHLWIVLILTCIYFDTC